MKIIIIIFVAFIVTLADRTYECGAIVGATTEGCQHQNKRKRKKREEEDLGKPKKKVRVSGLQRPDVPA